MKRIILLSLILVILPCVLSAQKLIDIYKKGPVKLVAEQSYGAKNNWESLFSLYYDTLSVGAGSEAEKKIIIAPDGSVFMSHKNRHEIWKFDPGGNFVKKIGTRGGKPDQFPMRPSVEAVIDGKYILTSDVNARLKFFDLDGKFFKSMTLKYMTEGFEPLNNGKLLLEGEVLWHTKTTDPKYSTNEWRHIIVLLDIYTGAEKIIYDMFVPTGTRFYNTANRDSMRIETVPPPDGKIYLPGYFIYRRPVFVFLKTGQFLLFDRKTGDVREMNADGKEINRFKLDITPLRVTDKDIEDHFESTRLLLQKSISQAKLMRDSTRISKGERGTTPGTSIKVFPNSDAIIKRGEEALSKIESLKDINAYYPNLPYFSNIIVDDEGNLLVFEFTSPEEKQSNIFNVIAYDANGQKLARTSFVCDDYDLSFNGNKFVISKGYVYAVAKLKNTSGMPLRLVKFRITN